MIEYLTTWVWPQYLIAFLVCAEIYDTTRKIIFYHAEGLLGEAAFKLFTNSIATIFIVFTLYAGGFY